MTKEAHDRISEGLQEAIGGGVLHIHAPPVLQKKMLTTTCPDCGKFTRMLQFFQEWYGWRSTCLKCGREWDCGEWIPLDFIRGIRLKNIESAKRRWRSLPPAPEAE